MDFDLAMTVDVLPVTSLKTSNQDVHIQRQRAVGVVGLIAFAFAGWLAFEIPKGTSGPDGRVADRRTHSRDANDGTVGRSLQLRSLVRKTAVTVLVELFDSAAIRESVGGRSHLASNLWDAHRDRPRLAKFACSAPPALADAAHCGHSCFLSFIFHRGLPRDARRWPDIFYNVGDCVRGAGAKTTTMVARSRNCMLAGEFTEGSIAILDLVAHSRCPFDRSRRARASAWRNWWLIGSMLLGIALMSIWPLLQLIKYEMPIGTEFHQEVTVWLGPEYLGKRPYLEVLLKLPLAGGAAGLFLLLAPVVVLFSKKVRPDPTLRELAIISLLFIALTIISNFRGVRYVLPIVPCLCLLLALTFCRFLEQGSAIRKRAVVGLAVILFAGFVHSELQIILRQKDLARREADR